MTRSDYIQKQLLLRNSLVAFYKFEFTQLGESYVLFNQASYGMNVKS